MVAAAIAIVHCPNFPLMWKWMNDWNSLQVPLLHYVAIFFNSQINPSYMWLHPLELTILLNVTSSFHDRKRRAYRSLWTLCMTFEKYVSQKYVDTWKMGGNCWKMLSNYCSPYIFWKKTPWTTFLPGRLIFHEHSSTWWCGWGGQGICLGIFSGHPSILSTPNQLPWELDESTIKCIRMHWWCAIIENRDLLDLRRGQILWVCHSLTVHRLLTQGKH